MSPNGSEPKFTNKALSPYRARLPFILGGIGALALFALPKAELASAVHAIPVKPELSRRELWAKSPAYLLSEADRRFNAECRTLRAHAGKSSSEELRDFANSFEAIACSLDHFQGVWKRAYPQASACVEKIAAAHAVYGFEVGVKQPKPTNDLIARVSAPFPPQVEREIRGAVSGIRYELRDLPPGFTGYNFCWRGTTNIIEETVHEVSGGGGGPILLSLIAQDWCMTAARYLRSCEAPLSAREVRALGRDLTCAAIAFEQGLRLSQEAK